MKKFTLSERNFLFVRLLKADFLQILMGMVFVILYYGIMILY